MAVEWIKCANSFYHREMPGISPSGFKAMARSPYEFANRVIDEDKEALILGSAFHTLVLENDLFLKQYDICGDGETRTAKKKKAAEAEGRKLLAYKDVMNMIEWQDALMAHPDARGLINAPGACEISGTWKDKDWGFERKFRLDKATTVADKNCVIDLKTFSMARNPDRDIQEAIHWEIISRKYHWQGLNNLEGATAYTGDVYDTFILVFVIKEWPYPVIVCILDDEYLERAAIEMQPVRALYASCLAEDKWEKENKRIFTIKSPRRDWK